MLNTGDGLHLDVGTRFVVHRRIGEGGFGVVYEAFDRQRGERVALKTLRQTSGEGLYRFKREFRALCDLSHPNLVTLHELLVHEGQWFFTMELVDGENFVQHIRRGRPSRSEDESSSDESSTVSAVPAGRFDDETMARFAGATRQLVEGLTALHESGQLHRDIKPSNVMVTRANRLVLLDFGLVTDLTTPISQRSMIAAGTPAYMSPEQAQNLPLSDASDWYSLGVMFYEVLTGTRPFDGGWMHVLEMKQRGDFVHPRDRDPSIPEFLSDICVALLDPKPEARLSGLEILQRLKREGRPPAERHRRKVGQTRRHFVGRGEELAVLHRAFRSVAAGSRTFVLASGASGIGKTALVRYFLELIGTREDALILTGRCYEQESVPFKAVDSVVDSLSRHLHTLPDRDVQVVLPRDIRALARVFPVLDRVEAIGRAARRGDIPDSQELRRRAFAALKELLGRLSDRRPIVIFIDDLQWGDADSASLLREVVTAADAPPLLLIGTVREDDAPLAMLTTLLSVGKESAVELVRLPLRELSPEEALELARANVESETTAERIARDSGGNPLFMSQLFLYLKAEEGSAGREVFVEDLADIVQHRLSMMEPEGRLLLELLAVAGTPLETEILSLACAGPISQAALASLRREHLVRHRSGDGRDRMEIFHDRIRQLILARLDALAIESHHRRLADALVRAGAPDPERLTIHYLGARDVRLAAGTAAEAARRAARALAFERAAALFRLAIDLHARIDGDTTGLHEQLGDALANAGRGAEAAEAYLKEEGEGEKSLDLHRKAAEQLLRSGHFDEGVRVLRIVLAKLDMHLPATPRGAFVALMLRRIQLRLRGLSFRERREEELPPEEKLKIDTCWPVAVGLMTVDSVRGAEFQTRHVLLALRSGEVYRIARALAMETAYTAAQGGRTMKRAEMLSQLTLSLAKRINQPHAIGLATLTTGVGAFCQGKWRKALDLCLSAEEIFRSRCTGVAWERDNAQLFALASLFFLGDLRRMSSWLPELIREAQQRGDIYAQTNLRIGFGFFSHLVWLAADQPERAREELRLGMEAWSNQSYHLQHYWSRGGEIDIGLYCGDDAGGFSRIPKKWRPISRAFTRFIQINLILALFARGRRNVAASRTSTEREELLRLVQRDAVRIEGERMAWAAPLAEMLRASVAAERNDGRAALGHLAKAESGFEAHDTALFAAIVRRRRGHLLGDVEIVEEAEAWMRQQCIRRPDRIEALYLPGDWESLPNVVERASS